VRVVKIVLGGGGGVFYRSFVTGCFIKEQTLSLFLPSFKLTALLLLLVVIIQWNRFTDIR
jgi:hypothetical protein